MVQILASFALKFVFYQAHGFADMMEKVDAPHCRTPDVVDEQNFGPQRRFTWPLLNGTSLLEFVIAWKIFLMMFMLNFLSAENRVRENKQTNKTVAKTG